MERCAEVHFPEIVVSLSPIFAIEGDKKVAAVLDALSEGRRKNGRMERKRMERKRMDRC